MRYIALLTIFFLFSCVEKKTSTADTKLFELKTSAIGIDFENTLTYDETFNPYVYRNFYNGGGVAIGDINNDGLVDIYFTGNLVPNKLYLNKGNWKFEDITEKAGVACPNVWSTGTLFADINGDGLLDLYVCKSGKPEGNNRHNELFINNGDLTFTEASKQYGLDITGLSVHAAFFDYDKDGDLDCYILNNSIRSVGAFDLIKDQRLIPDPSDSGNKFLRNDDGKFVDITEEAGIYSSKIGFGLGITLGDFNNDNWTDIFVSNDFFEKDYLYLNTTQGGFNEAIEENFQSISMGSMGADLADLDNDLRTDLMVTEMMPATDERQKTKTIFESWDKQQQAIQQGYFKQFSRNTLQRNLGNGNFVELARQAQVSATEWSWSALLFDMDNDGLRDIYVSNGIYKDLLDRDYLTYEANNEVIKNRINSNEKEVIKKLIDAMPSQALPNAVFRNTGNFEFEDNAASWGLDQPSFSNGSAYADLDNDGDLDIVVNNVNMSAFLYENKTDTLVNRSLTLKLSQPNKNVNALAAKAVIKYDDDKYAYSENFNSRGFQSSVDPKIHFGVGPTHVIDSLWITWPDDSTTGYSNLQTNQIHHISKKADSNNNYKMQLVTTNATPKLKSIAPIFSYRHKENKFIDFNRERLLPQMFSNEGPAFAAADIDRDGKQDFFVGGAKNQAGSLFLSSKNYVEHTNPFRNEMQSEDTDALFFDGDNDGDLDLYVCHGGKAFSPYAIELHDAFYENKEGNFVKATNTLSFAKPISTSVVKAADYDKDGDIDIFVGERFKTNLYGLPGSGFILTNNGSGQFTPVSAPILNDIGMITDAHWADLNNDGWEDLIVVGEWMPITLFWNKNGTLEKAKDRYKLGNSAGLWTALEVADLDSDGDLDIIAGNLGRNNYYSDEMRMYISDFDGNGFQEQLICKKVGDSYYPIVDKDELISQIPSLKKKLVFYKDYAKATMKMLFSEEILKAAYFVDLKMLNSTVFFNENDKFTAKSLPSEIQYAPVYTISANDINEDGKIDLFFGGNQDLVKPRFGRYDASKGWGIMGPIDLDKDIAKPYSLKIDGQIRNLKIVKFKNSNILIAALNNEETVFFTIEK